MREKKQINIEIGERIKNAREQRKITQEKLAERVEVSPQYISDLERGVVGVSVSTLKNICLALDVTSDSLLFDVVQDSEISVLVECCRRLNKKQFSVVEDIIRRLTEAFNE